MEDTRRHREPTCAADDDVGRADAHHGHTGSDAGRAQHQVQPHSAARRAHGATRG